MTQATGWPLFPLAFYLTLYLFLCRFYSTSDNLIYLSSICLSFYRLISSPIFSFPPPPTSALYPLRPPSLFFPSLLPLHDVSSALYPLVHAGILKWVPRASSFLPPTTTYLFLSLRLVNLFRFSMNMPARERRNIPPFASLPII